MAKKTVIFSSSKVQITGASHFIVNFNLYVGFIKTKVYKTRVMNNLFFFDSRHVVLITHHALSTIKGSIQVVEIILNEKD